MSDAVNNPKHYNAHPSGVECITVTEHMNFNLGNAVKYIWRAGEKGNEIEDLQKARWYLDREIERLGSLNLSAIDTRYPYWRCDTCSYTGAAVPSCIIEAGKLCTAHVVTP